MRNFVTAFILGASVLAGCSTPGAIPSTAFDLTLPLGANNAPLVLHCVSVPLACSGTYVVDGQTITVVYPVPHVSPSP